MYALNKLSQTILITAWLLILAIGVFNYERFPDHIFFWGAIWFFLVGFTQMVGSFIDVASYRKNALLIYHFRISLGILLFLFLCSKTHSLGLDGFKTELLVIAFFASLVMMFYYWYIIFFGVKKFMPKP